MRGTQGYSTRASHVLIKLNEMKTKLFVQD